MSIEIDRIGPGPMRAGLEALHRNWGWYLALGILLAVLGLAAIGAPWVATAAAVLAFGAIMIVGGIGQLVGAFWARRWSGFFLALLTGVLYLVVGVSSLRHPAKMSLALTLLIACFLLVGGIFRVVAALTLRFFHWGWAVAGGILSTLLGLLILAELPASAIWVIGTFIGIDMLFQGWTWILLGLAVRKLPAKAA